jgi:hypothetical protein
MLKNKDIMQGNNILFILLLVIVTISIESGATTYINL